MQSFWDLNNKYPEYTRAIHFDHASPAYHDPKLLNDVHKEMTQKAIAAGIKDLTTQIEIAQEAEQDTTALFKQPGQSGLALIRI